MSSGRSIVWLARATRQRLPTTAALSMDVQRMFSMLTASAEAPVAAAGPAASPFAARPSPVVRSLVGLHTQPLSQRSVSRMLGAMGTPEQQRVLLSTYSKKATLSRAEAEANMDPSDAGKQGVFALHLNDARLHAEVGRGACPLIPPPACPSCPALAAR
jgi:hypothetical protein